jgi:hypothetical protein
MSYMYYYPESCRPLAILISDFPECWPNARMRMQHPFVVQPFVSAARAWLPAFGDFQFWHWEPEAAVLA